MSFCCFSSQDCSSYSVSMQTIAVLWHRCILQSNKKVPFTAWYPNNSSVTIREGSSKKWLLAEKGFKRRWAKRVLQLGIKFRVVPVLSLHAPNFYSFRHLKTLRIFAIINTLETQCHIKENPSYFHVIHFLDIRWQSPHFIFHTRGPYPFQKSNATFFSTGEQSVWPVGSEAVGKAHRVWRLPQHCGIHSAATLLQFQFSFDYEMQTSNTRTEERLKKG